MIQHCFAPVTRSDTQLLVLGSLPGAMSLTAGRYYANPRNQFWRLMGAVLGEPLPSLGYEARLDRLLARGVGLWDTVAAAERPGSLDADIRLERSSDITALAGTLPCLRAIAFNGGTASRIGRRQLAGPTPFDLIDLPSSSPAHTLAFETKLQKWCRLEPYLLPPFLFTSAG